MPLVSIITVALNSAATIRDTIESVLSQTYPNIEYIVIDGNSTDSTVSIIKSYGSRIAKVISEPDHGIFDAMNKGVAAASGEIIGILNSDDVFDNPNVIAAVAEAMEKSQADVCWGDLVYVKKDELGKITRRWRSSPYMPGQYAVGWQPPHPSFFVKKTLYDEYGMYETKLSVSADYELMLRLLEKHKVHNIYIPQVITRMREGGNSDWKSMSTVLQGNREVMQAWKMNGLRLPFYTIPLKLWYKLKQVKLF